MFMSCQSYNNIHLQLNGYFLTHLRTAVRVHGMITVPKNNVTFTAADKVTCTPDLQSVTV